MSHHNDPIFEMYLYESTQMIEQTEAIILEYDQVSKLDELAINDIFRYMHTLKGSSAMMQFEGITATAHKLEDIIHFIREYPTIQYNPISLINLILESIDYFKAELVYISLHNVSLKNEAYTIIKQQLTSFLDNLKQQIASSVSVQQDDLSTLREVLTSQGNHFSLHIKFTDDCEMENIRAYQLLHHLESMITVIETRPNDLINDEQASAYIKVHGFSTIFESNELEQTLLETIEQTSYIKSITLQQDSSLHHAEPELLLASTINNRNLADIPLTSAMALKDKLSSSAAPKTSVVSVNVQKLDKLMDLVGELVIAEAMVSNTLKSYSDDSLGHVLEINHLSKITSDLQDTIMSIRMVPLSPVFHKMRRITRDMCQKLNKEANIEIIGEETEIDKSVIDQISDPLMHIIRNCIDHGIEHPNDRIAAGKNEQGKVIMEAQNIGSDVLLIISDDGKGINKALIFEKAVQAGLIHANATHLSDREIFQFIFHPGLSTKDEITEFSGRGVGMDVVASNIEQIGGTIYIESVPNTGTTFTIKIPLTLAIIDGMNIRVGQSHFTVPTTSIKESFRPAKNQIIHDTSGQSMVMVRGEIYSIMPLGKLFSIDADYVEPDEAILVIIEHEQKTICIQVDELVGQQQVVIKPLPDYLKNFTKSNRLSGCTLLGNGNISIILNINELVHNPTL